MDESNEKSQNEGTTKNKDTFMYFGYGSNMLEERIHIKNPSARFIGVSTLKNYKFGFEKTNDLPHDFGAIATIRPGTDSDEVKGCVWEIDLDQVENLDRQEFNYKPIEVDVILDDGSIARCRTYEMKAAVCTGETKPHPFYKRICVEGAKQHNLPEDYICFLESCEDTNQPRKHGFYEALVPVIEKLDRAKIKM